MAMVAANSLVEETRSTAHLSIPDDGEIDRLLFPPMTDRETIMEHMVATIKVEIQSMFGSLEQSLLARLGYSSLNQYAYIEADEEAPVRASHYLPLNTECPQPMLTETVPENARVLHKVLIEHAEARGMYLFRYMDTELWGKKPWSAFFRPSYVGTKVRLSNTGLPKRLRRYEGKKGRIVMAPDPDCPPKNGDVFQVRVRAKNADRGTLGKLPRDIIKVRREYLVFECNESVEETEVHDNIETAPRRASRKKGKTSHKQQGNKAKEEKKQHIFFYDSDA